MKNKDDQESKPNRRNREEEKENINETIKEKTSEVKDLNVSKK